MNCSRCDHPLSDHGQTNTKRGGCVAKLDGPNWQFGGTCSCQSFCGPSPIAMLKEAFGVGNFIRIHDPEKFAEIIRENPELETQPWRVIQQLISIQGEQARELDAAQTEIDRLNDVIASLRRSWDTSTGYEA